jgi:hypothetical protein
VLATLADVHRRRRSIALRVKRQAKGIEPALRRVILRRLPCGVTLTAVDRVNNPGGEVTRATWFELPASHLDELTPGEYKRNSVGVIPSKNRMGRKSSRFSCGEL